MNDEKDKHREEISRREFFLKVGNSAVGITLAGGSIVTWRYLWPNVLFEAPNRFRAGVVAEMAPGTVIFNPEYRVFIFREQQGYFYAVSAICTHLGCTTNWRAEGAPGHAGGVIACPCHGSIFSKTGEVIVGPAPRDLDRFRMTLEEGELVVDTGEKVNEEEMILRV